jgi:hypothetical protein
MRGRREMSNAKRREVSLGGMEAPLTKQLAGLADKEKLKLLDQHSSRITWLHLHGLLSDRETDAVRKRLMKRVQHAVTSHTEKVSDDE